MSVHVSEIHHHPYLCLARNRYLMYFANDCSVHVFFVCFFFFSSSVFSRLTLKGFVKSSCSDGSGLYFFCLPCALGFYSISIIM